MIVRVLSVLAAVAAAGIAATPASAHGGSYRPPGGSPGGGLPPDALPDPRVPEPTPPDRGTMTPWERWWDANRFRFLDLRSRIRMRDARGAATSLTAEDRSPLDGPQRTPPTLRAQAEREALPVVTAALSDQDSEVRSAAALALGKMGFPRSLVDLTRATRDASRDVAPMVPAADALVVDSSRQTLEQVVDFLASEARGRAAR